MTPWFHIRHVLLMPATHDCAWLLKMPILATMRDHRLPVSLDPWHHDPLGPCTPVRVSSVESVGCLCLFALLQRFATFFEICGCDCCDSSIEICSTRQSIYSVLWRGCWGWANHLNPGCSSVAFWQQRAVSPLWLGFASADVGWVIWIEVVITPKVNIHPPTLSAIPAFGLLGS